MFISKQSVKSRLLHFLFLHHVGVFQLSVRPSPKPWSPTTRSVSIKFIYFRNVSHTFVLRYMHMLLLANCFFYILTLFGLDCALIKLLITEHPM